MTSSPSDLPPGLPPSEWYTLCTTLHSGRGVFATRQIPTGTPLLTATDLTTLLLHREYRREVCTNCFAYDCGLAHPLHDPTANLTFCTKRCRNAWHAANGPPSLAAHRAVHALLRSNSKQLDLDDVAMGDACPAAPSPSAVERAWKLAAAEGRRVAGARTAAEPSKAETRALRAALARPADPGVLPYLLSAVLAASVVRERWEALLELKATETPYASFGVLERHVAGFLQLVAVVPEELLGWVGVGVVRAAVDRDAHNSFGVRSLDDGGAEMFGFGVWPSASYWNHSCRPNLGKRRVGRDWEFWAEREVAEGEELCITYLGLETAELKVRERRERLRETWGFECYCARCVEESRVLEGEGAGVV